MTIQGEFEMQDLQVKPKTRIYYFDALKTISIFLVCIYHYNALNLDIINNPGLGVYINYLFYGLSSMAVPLFFMVNGALLLNRPYRLGKHIKKTIYLYILLNLWSLISLALFIPIDGATYSIKEFVSAWFLLKVHVSNHLWFLQALISVYLLFPVIKAVYDLEDNKLTLKILCFVVFIFSFGSLFLHTILNVAETVLGFNYINSNSFNFFPGLNPFNQYAYTYIYFILGGILSAQFSPDKIGAKRTISLRKKSLFSFLLAWVSLFLYGVMTTVSSQSFYDTVWNGYYSMMTLVMSAACFYFLSSLSYGNKLLNSVFVVVGTSTFGIYLLHRFVGAVSIKYFQNIPFSTNLFPNLLYCLGVVAVTLLAVQVLKAIPLFRKTVDL
ncbi:acyltransferase [Acaryochloris sp. CCMEE 5410]|uniref:acyltransferase n=1 Tax=Acaryochloris sp. CCMEE 5410 TaxID=310037 RepID=UPI0002485207|nr:acyltransferase [Acaryochloris sp. CCMEE 5410]KAI9135305.1 acyltransferase [Acaryochloris sp. CCMEE 5410]